jgi:hypothetical protein
MGLFKKSNKNNPYTIGKVTSKKTLPPKPGYITGGTETTRTYTTVSGNNSAYQGSSSFQTAFGKARKSGASTFQFGGKSYSTKIKTSKPNINVTSTKFTTQTGGIKANPIEIKANVLLDPVKPPVTPTNNKIIPPKPPKPPKRKKKFRNTDVGKFVRSIGDIQLPQIRLPRIRLGGGGGGGCKSCRKKLLRTFGSRR